MMSVISFFSSLIVFWSLVFVGSGRLIAAQSNAFNLTEKALLQLALDSNPSESRFAAQQQKLDLAATQYQERFQSHLFGSAYYGRSNLDPVAPFSPTFSPTEGFEVGVKNYLGSGLNGSISVFSDQISADDLVERSTSAGIKANLTMDIWKNFLGKFDSLDSSSLDLQKKQARLRRITNTIEFKTSLRKIYWSLVTNHESSKLTRNILNTAENQKKTAEKRLKESVGNAADVSRYRAQVNSHKATLTALDYQRESLFLKLKKYFPKLGHQVIQLGKYDVSDLTKQVSECSSVIKGEKSLPWKYTFYDEKISILEADYANKTQASGRYDMADVQVFAEAELSGRGEEYSGGYESITEKGRSKYMIGLNLSVPLGGARTASSKAKTHLEKNEFMASKENFNAQVNARHQQMIPMLAMLTQAIESRKASSASLEKALGHSKKMYNQARVSVDVLIRDQSALLANKLEELKIKQTIINEFLDYFQIFSETPCELNLLRNYKG